MSDVLYCVGCNSLMSSPSSIRTNWFCDGSCSYRVVTSALGAEIKVQFFKVDSLYIIYNKEFGKITIYYYDKDFLNLLREMVSDKPYTKKWLDSALTKYKNLLIFI